MMIDKREPGPWWSMPLRHGRRLFNDPRNGGWLVASLIWVVLMLSLPLVDWATQGAVFPIIVTITTLAQAVAVVAMLRLGWSGARVFETLMIVAIGTWLAEYAGSNWGLLFGAYDYSPLLQPQLAGVPLLIPLAWMMMLPAAWAVASKIVSPKRQIIFALVSALVFTAWDLYLDPQWVARGLWTWAEPGVYFGIPLSNFAGWLITSCVVTYLVNPSDLGDAQRPLAVVYTVVWMLQAIGLGVFWGQPGPALVGFLAMGAFSIWYWRRAR
jgi:putative membrane protein